MCFEIVDSEFKIHSICLHIQNKFAAFVSVYFVSDGIG
jgi:hypothetical protein